MSGRGHFRILIAATVVWAAFWVLGLPSYYQQYSRSTMIVVCLALLPAVVAVCYLLLRHMERNGRLARAAWLAFYFTVPLALYDWLYCGAYLGYGASFFCVFWYLTVFYVVPWLVLPATAVILNHVPERTSKMASDERKSGT
jgi:hypothetical protein